MRLNKPKFLTIEENQFQYMGISFEKWFNHQPGSLTIKKLMNIKKAIVSPMMTHPNSNLTFGKYPGFNENFTLYLHPKGGTVYEKEMPVTLVNKEGTFILKKCNAKQSIKQIIRSLQQEFDSNIPTKEFQQNVKSFFLESYLRGYLKFHDKPSQEQLKIYGNKDLWAPRLLTIEVTYRCNLSCKFCYASARNRSRELTPHTLRSLIRDLAEIRTHLLVFTGGEPFLRKDLFSILDSCEQHQLYFRILTNGTRVETGMVERLARYQYLDEIQISLDSANPEKFDYLRGKKGTFNKVIKSIRDISGGGIPVSVAAVYLPGTNEEELEDIAGIAKEGGSYFFKIGMPYMEGKLAELIQGRFAGKKIKYDAKTLILIRHKIASIASKMDNETFKVLKVPFKYIYSQDALNNPKVTILKEMKCREAFFANLAVPNFCGSGYVWLNLTPEGQLTLCNNCLDYPLGNIYETNLKEIFKSKMTFFFAELAPPIPSICGTCEYFFYCSGCKARGIVMGKRMENCNWYQYANRLFQEKVAED